MAPCLPVLGYLIDCPLTFKVLGRIELILKNKLLLYLMNNSFYTVDEFLENTMNN
jgi:hypothetical protein